jgi:hypothetical protein
MDNEGPPAQRLQIETESESEAETIPDVGDNEREEPPPPPPREEAQANDARFNAFAYGVNRNIYRKRGRRDLDWVYDKYIVDGHFDGQSYYDDCVLGTDFNENPDLVQTAVHYLKNGQVWPWDAINACLSLAIIQVRPGCSAFRNYFSRSKWDWRECFKPYFITLLPLELNVQLVRSFLNVNHPDHEVWESWDRKYSRTKLPSREFRDHVWMVPYLIRKRAIVNGNEIERIGVNWNRQRRVARN